MQMCMSCHVKISVFGEEILRNGLPKEDERVGGTLSADLDPTVKRFKS